MNYFKITTSSLAVLALLVINHTSYASCKYDKIVKGEELGIGVMLEWSTQEEENNAMFIIEKSLDGFQFTKVGMVEGSGNSEEAKKYSFLDIMARNNKLFYRLKQMDFDGSFSYSEIISITKQQPNHYRVVKMSSIVTIDQFEVTIDALKNGRLSYSLKDAQGNPLNKENTIVYNGLNLIQVDVSLLFPGIYTLELKMDDEVETVTFKKIPENNKKPQLATTDKLKH